MIALIMWSMFEKFIWSLNELDMIPRNEIYGAVWVSYGGFYNHKETFN